MEAVPRFIGDPGEEMIGAMKDVSLAGKNFNYFFEHNYTLKSMADLGVGVLKGQDRSRMTHLRSANERLPVQEKLAFFLTKGEKKEEYYADGYYPGDDPNHPDQVWRLRERGSGMRMMEMFTLEGKDLGGGIAGKSLLWRREGQNGTPLIKLEDVLNPEGKSVEDL